MFVKGQVVRCIDDNFDKVQRDLIPNRPVKGELYIVRDSTRILTLDSIEVVYLEELVNPHLKHPSNKGTFEPYFKQKIFESLDNERRIRRTGRG